MPANKLPPKFLPPWSGLLDIIPKALWADVAWNLALRLDGEERDEGALNIVLEEAELVRPEGRWRKKLEAATRRALARKAVRQ